MEEEGHMEVAGGGEDLGSVRSFAFWVAARRRFKSDDPIFTAGNMERELLAKQVAIDLTEDERYQLQKIVDADTHVASCPIVGCEAHLNSLEDFEDHYHVRHTASCSVCSRVYPTSRLLSIHVSEAHNSFFQEKVTCGYPMEHIVVVDHTSQAHLPCRSELLPDSSSSPSFPLLAVSCPIVGCEAHLNSLEDFEDHYHARHTASCSVCSRVYPTSRLLSIHVSEAHDSFFQAKVARGFPMYECLVEGCGMKLKSYSSRQQHLVDKHKFPKLFEFFRKAHPSKHQRRRSLKHAGSRREGMRDMDMDVDKKPSKPVHQRYRQKHAGGKEETKEITKSEVLLQDGREQVKDTEMKVDEKMEDLVSAVSKLSTSDSTPSSICFGHRRAGGFAFVPRSVRQDKKPTAQQGSKG